MRTLIVIAVVIVLLASIAYIWILHMPGYAARSDSGMTSAESVELLENLTRHVRILAVDIGERHAGRLDQLDRAADYIVAQFNSTGLGVHTQTYAAYGETFRNVQAEQRGRTAPDEIVVIGAHYDSVPGSPAANDNGTGVAALLELARLNRGEPRARTLRFVAFANEEQPHSGTDAMGSRVYAARASQRGDNIVAMISLETIGYYSDQPDSQNYPVPLSWFYPDTGDFVAFVANLRSRSLVRAVIASFRRHAAIPSEGIAAPEWLRDIARSDHASFWAFGFPALMVTDTAGFRYPYYHTAQDTPDRIDYERLTQVVLGLNLMIGDLATRHD